MSEIKIKLKCYKRPPIKTMNSMWIGVSKNGDPQLYSLKFTKKECIVEMTTGTKYSWKEIQSFGWTCQKINITFTKVNK